MDLSAVSKRTKNERGTNSAAHQGSRLELYSENGEVHVEFEILVNEPGDLEILILTHMRALKDLFRRVRRWFDKDGERNRSIYGEFQLAKL